MGYWGPFKPLVYGVSINSLDPLLGDERSRRECQYLELEIPRAIASSTTTCFGLFLQSAFRSALVR